MGRSAGSFPVLLALLWGSSALANIPDPGLSTIPTVVVSPSGTLDYSVNIVGQLGPMNTATVELIWSAEADSLMCWCTGENHPLITSTTDPSGTAVFNIAAGGCLDPSLLSGGIAVEVFANGFKMAEVGVVSSDLVDGSGIRATQGWNPAGSCAVGLSDASAHTNAFATGIYDFCSDINSDLTVSLDDAVILTQPITDGLSCPQAP